MIHLETSWLFDNTYGGSNFTNPLIHNLKEAIKDNSLKTISIMFIAVTFIITSKLFKYNICLNKLYCDAVES